MQLGNGLVLYGNPERSLPLPRAEPSRRSFARIQSSIIVHLAQIVLGEQQPLRHGTDLWANRSRFGQVSYENAFES